MGWVVAVVGILLVTAVVRDVFHTLFGCVITLLLSLIVMVRTVRPGRVGAGYAGLFGVRYAGGRL